MDTRKVTLVATIAVIALVAVGIGYAYTAATTNTGNNASPEYITLVQGSTGAYQFSEDAGIFWNTTDYRVDSQPYTDFTIAAVTEAIPGMTLENYKAVKIGKPFTLVADTVGTETEDTQTVSIKADNLPGPFKQETNIKATVVFYVSTGDDKEYFWVTDENVITEYNAAGSAAGDNLITLYKDTDNAYKPATVQAYYLTKDPKITVAHEAGVAPEGPENKPLENTSLSFTISTDSYNPGTHVPVTGITLDKYQVLLHLNGQDPATVTATIGPNDATDKGITVSGYDSSIVDATVTGLEITLKIPTTDPAAGTTNVVVSTNEGGFIKVIEVIVADHFVDIGLGSHMTLTSGSLIQGVAVTGNMKPIMITADEGYYFPNDYAVSGLTINTIGTGSGNSIVITKNGIAADVTVSELTAPTQMYSVTFTTDVDNSSISASVGGVEITSGTYVTNGTEVDFTYTASTDEKMPSNGDWVHGEGKISTLSQTVTSANITISVTAEKIA